MSRRRRDYSYYPTDVRSSTPVVRDNEEMLHIRHSNTEGHYDIACDVPRKVIEVRFSFYHNQAFLPPREVFFKRYDTREDVIAQFTAWKYSAYEVIHALNPSQTFCTPVLLRDQLIDELKHDPNKSMFRQRRGHKFLVRMIFSKTNCDAWHINHYHGVKVRIEDGQTGKLAHEETFDCDHVWEGVLRYQYVLAHFDMAYMEMHL